MSNEQEERQFASIHVPLNSTVDKLGDLPVEVIPASEAWKIGLSASDVRWLLGIPEPPRKPPSYAALLRRCQREGCEFTVGVAEGWEVCHVHGVARKAR